MVGVEVPVSDVERRRAHIDLVNPKHPLVGAITSCPAYAESERPCVQTSDSSHQDLWNRPDTSSQELSKLKNDLQMQLIEKEMEVLSAKEDKRVAEEAMRELQSKLEVKDKELRAAESVKIELLEAKDRKLRAAEESRKELQKQLRVKNEELLLVYEQLKKEQQEVEMLTRKQDVGTGDQMRAEDCKHDQINFITSDGKVGFVSSNDVV